MKIFLDEPGLYVAGDKISRGLFWRFEPDRTIKPDKLIPMVEKLLDALKRANTHIRL